MKRLILQLKAAPGRASEHLQLLLQGFTDEKKSQEISQVKLEKSAENLNADESNLLLKANASKPPNQSPKKTIFGGMGNMFGGALNLMKLGKQADVKGKNYAELKDFD